MKAPVLAIGVLAHDEESSIERMLASVMRQSLWRRIPPERRQIVVYANGCRDATAAVARRFAARTRELEVVETPVQGKSQGWNVLKTHLRRDADWWVFADADVILHWKALERLFEGAASHPDASVVSATTVSSARYLPPEARGFLTAARVESERWKRQRREVSARLYAIRREVAEGITLPPGILNEDRYLSRLLGSERIWRSLAAWVFEREPTHARDLVRYQLRTRIGSFQARRLEGRPVDSNKTLRFQASRTAIYRRLTWRAWVGKAMWVPLRIYVEWKARRVPPESLGESFWMKVTSGKLSPPRHKAR
jgi:cellulose synthase/poly-beta-1,6-N-acetylglucosamine synthase-like glycosyltransferase